MANHVRTQTILRGKAGLAGLKKRENQQVIIEKYLSLKELAKLALKETET